MIRAILALAMILTASVCDARDVLTGNDLTYLGSFAMPRSLSDGSETPYGAGLALRRVGGEVRLFSTSYQSGQYPLYEVTVPALKTSPPWNAAPVARAWGNVLTNSDGWVNGLHWDETDKRLYYSSSWNYVASGDPYSPTLGFLSFNSDGTQATSHGRWGFSNRSFKQVNFGVTSVPADFATQYLQGKRLAAGFGGYQSVLAHGPVSLGPSLTAFSPPAVGTEGGYLPNTPLVGYGGGHAAWTSGSRPTVNRAWRDDDAIHDLYGAIDDPDNSTQNFSPYWHLSGDEHFYWQGYSVKGNSRAGYPDNITFADSAVVTKHWVPGNAFWNTDRLGQSGTWIQTANKEGVLLLATFDTGHVWYYTSDSHAEGIKHKWLVYSRDQLASVVQGAVREDQIQPTRYDANFSASGVPTALPHAGVPAYTCTGMAFDPVDNKLYVSLQYASNAPTVNSNSTHLVYVYQVNDSVVTPPPTASSPSLAPIQHATGGTFTPKVSWWWNGSAYVPRLLRAAGDGRWFSNLLTNDNKFLVTGDGKRLRLN